MPSGEGNASRDQLDAAIEAGIAYLDGSQDPDGYWMGFLGSNSCMEAEYLLALHILGQKDERTPKIIRAILNEQNEDGTWHVYHCAPEGDINTTVECYAALRLHGYAPDSPELDRARKFILEKGGIAKSRVFTKIWMALVGEWPWDGTPALPPEIIFLPSWMPCNIYDFASWARGTVVPLALVAARRPVVPLPEEAKLDELFPDGRDAVDTRLPLNGSWFSVAGLMYAGDALVGEYEKVPWKPFRETARKWCLDWILRRQEADGTWGGTQPPWLYGIMALYFEGYAISHPAVQAGLNAFRTDWAPERNGGVYVQASESPAWDTVLAMRAILDCGVSPTECEPIRKAMRWCLKQQVTGPGDWQVKVRGVPGGGWSFEKANTWYPDTDDSAETIIALHLARDCAPDPEKLDRAIDRAAEWMVALQCKNGGWGAFDRDNDNRLVTMIPFSDFGELLDPPSVDVTGHMLEAFAMLGWKTDHPVVEKALAYVRGEQEKEGSWFGRWGVNHLYGTGAILPALAELGLDMSEPWIRKGADWVVAHQNDDGGWGESCGSYMDDSLRGVGASTASQTGWALIALLAMDSLDYREPIRKGIAYLVSRQEDGTWVDRHCTGTGFPGYGHGGRSEHHLGGRTHDHGAELSRGFMINYEMYAHYWPLMALGRARAFFDRHGVSL